MSLTWISLSPLPSNAISVHQCHPQKLPLSPQPLPALSLGIFVQWPDVIWGLVTGAGPALGGGLSLLSCWLPFAGPWEPSEGSITDQKIEQDLGWCFFLQLISVVSFAASVFHFLGIPADRNALSICAKSFSSWLEGNCCSPDYVPIIASCTAEVPHKILCFHGDLPSTFPKRTH